MQDSRSVTSKPPAPGAPGTLLQQAIALGELTLVFAATHVAYRALKQFTPLGAWEQAAGANFIPGTVFSAVTIARIVLGRRSCKAYGLSLGRLQQDLALGVVCSLFLLALATAALLVTGSSYEAGRPPDPAGPPPWGRILGALLLGCAGLLVGLVLIGRGTSLLKKIPLVVSLALLGCLFAMPIALGIFKHRPEVGLTALWLFFGAGLGEELFFRGYIQSRADEPFGSPYRLGGCNIGLGLLISSFFFGLIHGLNTVDYFEGRWTFGWAYALQSLFVGFFYGFLRARTRTIWAGAIIHGLLDLWAIVPGLLRGA